VARDSRQDMGTTCSNPAQPKGRPPSRASLLLQTWHRAAPPHHPSAELAHETAKG